MAHLKRTVWWKTRSWKSCCIYPTRLFWLPLPIQTWLCSSVFVHLCPAALMAVGGRKMKWCMAEKKLLRLFLIVRIMEIIFKWPFACLFISWPGHLKSLFVYLHMGLIVDCVSIAVCVWLVVFTDLNLCMHSNLRVRDTSSFYLIQFASYGNGISCSYGI